MNLDIRVPIGTMFSLIGLVLFVYGLLTSGSDIYAKHALGINMNLYWGLIMVVFGGLMFIFGLKAQSKSKEK